MDKFHHKYRIPSIRLQNWDYGWNVPYFVTICTVQKECYFGKIRGREMYLSEIGEIVSNEWLKTPIVRPDMNLILDVFVVMPNHFHGIIIIGQNVYNRRRRDAMPGVSCTTAGEFDSGLDAMVVGIPNTTAGEFDSGINETADVSIPTVFGSIPWGDARHGVSTANPDSIDDGYNSRNPTNRFGPQIKNLSSVIRGFKSAVTIKARKINPGFAWQPRYHEHIIWDEKSHTRIRNYIIENPEHWCDDDLHD